MKLFGRRPSPVEVAESIATLERELGIDDKTVLGEVEQRKLDRFNSKRGAVILDAPVRAADVVGSRRSAINALASRGILSSSAASEMDLRPGFKWPIFEPSDVQFVAASAVSTNFHQVIPALKSRVVLPPGVRV